jgi:hypothetical protein
MKINEKLNLVIPIYTDDKISAYVHSTPISRETYEVNYLLLAKTFTAIHAEGVGEITAPRVAALMMKDFARRDNNPNAAEVLMNEIRRLSSVVQPNPNGSGWQAIPLQEAISKKSLDEDDISEVENAVAFFICVVHLYPKNLVKGFLTGAMRLWGSQITPHTSTEFIRSLPILNVAEDSSKENVVMLSLPS